MTSDPFARSRLRKVLVAVILATIPCYCAGLVAVLLAPGRPGQTSITPTLVSSWTPVVFVTRTPTTSYTPLLPTISATPSQTPTVTTTATTTNTSTITPTPTISTTPTPTNTPFLPPTFTSTQSLPPTYTSTPIPSATHTPLPTFTDTPISTDTPTATINPSITPTPPDAT